MYSLTRLKQIAEEKEAKRLEREQKRKEKEKEKRKLKSLEKRRKARNKHSKKYYAKIKQERLRQRAEIGDEKAYFTILLTKNRKRIKRIGASLWKTDAYKIYNEAIKQNREEVKFPIKIVSTDTNNRNSIIYEIVIIRKIKDNESTISKLRNKDGKYVDNIIIDKNSHIIIDKCEWYVEETFNVYGFNPIRDRKTFDFILNNILLKNIETKYDIKTIFTYNNKVFIKTIDDFDFIICKTADDALRLADQLNKNIPKNFKKNIIYIGEINKGLVSQLVQDMMDKTGWTKQMCLKSKL